MTTRTPAKKRMSQTRQKKTSPTKTVKTAEEVKTDTELTSTVEEDVHVVDVDEQVKSYVKQYGKQFKFFYDIAQNRLDYTKEQAFKFAKERLHIEISEEHKQELKERLAHARKIYNQINR